MEVVFLCSPTLHHIITAAESVLSIFYQNAHAAEAEERQQGNHRHGPKMMKEKPPLPHDGFVVEAMRFYDADTRQWLPLFSAAQLHCGDQVYCLQSRRGAKRQCWCSLSFNEECPHHPTMLAAEGIDALLPFPLPPPQLRLLWSPYPTPPSTLQVAEVKASTPTALGEVGSIRPANSVTSLSSLEMHLHRGTSFSLFSSDELPHSRLRLDKRVGGLNSSTSKVELHPKEKAESLGYTSPSSRGPVSAMDYQGLRGCLAAVFDSLVGLAESSSPAAAITTKSSTIGSSDCDGGFSPPRRCYLLLRDFTALARLTAPHCMSSDGLAAELLRLRQWTLDDVVCSADKDRDGCIAYPEWVAFAVEYPDVVRLLYQYVQRLATSSSSSSSLSTASGGLSGLPENSTSVPLFSSSLHQMPRATVSMEGSATERIGLKRCSFACRISPAASSMDEERGAWNRHRSSSCRARDSSGQVSGTGDGSRQGRGGMSLSTGSPTSQDRPSYRLRTRCEACQELRRQSQQHEQPNSHDVKKSPILRRQSY